MERSSLLMFWSALVISMRRAAVANWREESVAA
jgi:hypothetical protein